jgi:hypothetical protein
MRQVLMRQVLMQQVRLATQSIVGARFPRPDSLGDRIILNTMI